MESTPFFNLPLNLPHASRVARRLLPVLEYYDAPAVHDTARQLVQLLHAGSDLDLHPPSPDMLALRDEAAVLARTLVAQIESADLRSDRVGQCVRNLFECLALGREGAILSLQAGEDPNSLQRPV